VVALPRMNFVSTVWPRPWQSWSQKSGHVLRTCSLILPIGIQVKRGLEESFLFGL